VLPPVLLGAAAQNAISGSGNNVFAAMSVQDASGSSVSVTFTLTGAAATLSGSGLTGSGPYTLTADTAANITTKLKALAFTSSASAGSTTSIAMVATSSTALTGSTSEVVTIIVPVSPVISGMVGPNVSMDQGAPPLWLISVTDANPGATVSASLAVTGGAGVMSHIGPTAPSGTGPYTFAADTPANLTRWLRNLLWAPSTHTAGTTSTFTVTITDNFGATASASNTITNVAPAAWPTALTPSATPAALPSNYFGLNMAGGENTPSPAWRTFQSQYNWALAHGLRTIRLPVSDSNLLAQGSVTYSDGSHNYLLYQNFNSGNVGTYQQCVECTRTAGQYALLDVHDFGNLHNPFYTNTQDDFIQGIQVGDIRTPISAFADFETRLAMYFKNYPNILLDTMNEPNSWSGPFDRAVMTAVSASVRANVSTTMPIIAPTPANASSFDTSGTWDGYTDPAGGPFFMGVHQYFDGAGGNGTSCLSTAPGGYFDTFVNYCRAQGFKAFISEFGWQTATNCNSGLGASIMAYFNTNSDVIKGWQWWSYGDFPTNYATYMGPTNGSAGEGDARGSPTDPVQYAALSPYLP
jgi:Cellulase (glycosyl hydrolase family 5)